MSTLPVHSDRTQKQASLKRLLEAIGWDGVLPLLVASGPIFVKKMLPRGHIAEVFVVVLVPIFAAIIRASVGRRQIVRICDGRAPWLRQIALAAAIVTLLFFEAVVGLLTFVGEEIPSAWWLALALYAAYVALVTYALRPGRNPAGIATTA
jgi:hypothetical protein